MMRLRIAGTVAGALLASGALLGGCAGADISEGVSLSNGLQSSTATMSDPSGASDPDTGTGTDGDTDATVGTSVSTTDPTDPTDPSADTTDPTADTTDPTDATAESGCVATDEVCDGDDNDCDGDIDENDPGIGLPCDTGMSGVCGAGTQECSEGALVCTPDMAAGAESCNGLDDDCDGTVDQGNPGGGGGCDTGQPGICGAGTSQCQSGGVACVQNQMSGAESCNGLDDDCDGTVDDGNPGGGGGCNTGLPGVCGPGTNTCQGGGVTCLQNQAAGGESCGNGLDDDCDGNIDNGCGCPHDLCTAGAAMVSGCDPCVTSVCASDPFCCNSSWDSLCVNEVETICLSAICPYTCGHSLCSTGAAVVANCDPSNCAGSICAADPFCCDSSFDGICAGETTSVCGLSC